MFDFLVNAEGGLTAAGYGVCIAAGIVLFITALIFAGRLSEKKRMGTKQLRLLLLLPTSNCLICPGAEA